MHLHHQALPFALAILAAPAQLACVLCSEEFPDGCLEQFNTCETERGALLAQTLVELDLRQAAVWTREMPVGNLIADAFYELGRHHCGGARPCPDAAFENAGAIRFETKCGHRELIPAGPLFEGDVNDMLPFASNRIGVVEISGHDLKLALEHAVDNLAQTRAGEQGGHFLQVSRLRFEVDCAQSRQDLDPSRTTIITPGARIVEGSLMIRTDSGGEGVTPVWEPVVTERTSTYRVVTNSFIGAGNDGYLALTTRQDTAEGETALTGDAALCDSDFLCKMSYYIEDNGQTFSDAQALAYYLRKQEKVAPQTEGRMVIRSNCVPGLE